MSYCLKPDVYYNKEKHPASGNYCATLGPGVPDICDSNIGETRSDCLHPAIDDGSMACTKDEWVIMGNCGSSLNPFFCDAFGLDNDCPYHCVPKHSVHTSGTTTGECSISEIIGSLAASYHGADANDYSASNGNFELGRYKGYDYVILKYGTGTGYYSAGLLEDCKAEGVPSSITIEGTTYSTASRGVVGSYFACEEAVQVSGGEPNGNKAWTDNLWSGRRPGPYQINVGTPTWQNYLSYSYPSVIEPFGRGIGEINNPGTDIYSIPTCQNTDTKELRLKTTALGCDTSFTPLPESGSGFIVPNEARSYTGISTSAYTPSGRSCAADVDCNTDRYCRNVLCFKSCASDSDCVVGSENYGPCDTTDHICGKGTDYNSSDPTIRVEDADPALCPFGFGTPLRGTCGTTSGISGSTCAASVDCQNWVCDPSTRKCRAPGDTFPVGSGTATIEDDWLAKAKSRIEQLFIQGMGLYTWSWSGAPADVNTAPNYGTLDRSNKFDDSSKMGVTGPGGQPWPLPPKLYALGDCIGEKCEIKTQGGPPLEGMSVNGVDGTGLTTSGLAEPKNVVGYGGEIRATLQFFAQTDKNTGPLRDVNIKWGDKDDGTDIVPHSGRYKNHLGIKSDGSSACDNSDFAHSTDACTEDYFTFTHSYTCSSSASTTKRACASSTDSNCYAAVCPEDVNGALPGTGSCCVFKPRVQLKDNWGWCNGTCVGEAHGCYAEECGLDREGMSGVYHWTDFAGKVIVVPK